MPKPKVFREIEEALRDFAMRFPGATEDHPWDHIAFKVKKKMFAVLGGTDEMLSITCKLPSSGRFALTLPFASPTGYGLGKSGWVSAQFKPTDKIPVDRMMEWIDESYRAIAPKKLVAELDGVPETKPAKKRKS